VQRLVNEMERDGLVRFGTNPHHQRSKLVLLTPRGRAAYDAAMKRQGPWARGLVAGLSTKQIEAATATLTRLDDQARAGERDA
jgi:DNA-binding MarR family transcriptional regulator